MLLAHPKLLRLEVFYLQSAEVDFFEDLIRSVDYTGMMILPIEGLLFMRKSPNLSRHDHKMLVSSSSEVRLRVSQQDFSQACATLHFSYDNILSRVSSLVFTNRDVIPGFGYLELNRLPGLSHQNQFVYVCMYEQVS